MMMKRRAAVVAIGVALGTGAMAQSSDWPTRPIRIVVSGAPGGAPDIFARHYADQLSRNLGKPVVVENKPGVAGSLAASTVATANDQHTLLWGFTSIFSINPHIYPKGPVDLRKDLIAVAPTVRQGLVLVANNDFPANNIPELVKLAKTKPGEIDYASYGVAGYPHLIMEVLQAEAGVRLRHIPYKQHAIVDVISGQVPMVVEPASTAVPQIRAGKVKALGYSSAQRNPSLPNVAPISETVPSFKEVNGIHAIWAPASMPRELIARLNTELNRVTEMPETARKLADVHCLPFSGSQAQISEVIESEYQRWGKIVRDNGIKLE